MADDAHTASLVDVIDETMGAALAADAAVSDVTLTVDNTIDFSEAGGLLRLNGVEYTYDEVDKEADTIHLTTPLTVAGVVGDPVAVMTEPGSQAHEYVALLEPPDPDGEPIPAIIPVALVGYFTIAEPGALVRYTSDGGTYRVLSRPDTEPAMDGAAVWNPYVARRATTVSVPNATWTTLTGWTNTVSQGVTIESDSSVTVIYPGFYVIDASPTFASSGSGYRYARVLVNGAVVGYLGIPADSAGSTDVPVAARGVLAQGDNVTVQVYQSSGASLSLVAGAGQSAFSMYRVSV